jgi:hypothetical protein
MTQPLELELLKPEDMVFTWQRCYKLITVANETYAATYQLVALFSMLFLSY